MKQITLLVFFCLQAFLSSAQSDTEFPKEFIMHFKLHNGMVTNFTNAPDVYVGGIQIVPQYTLVKNKLRGGFIAGGYYTAKAFQAAVGPTLSFKLKTFKAAPFGSAGNIHINIDHVWGTNKEKLFGGGFNIDLANKLVLSITAHRDYNLNTWWFQNAVGIRVSKVKKLPDLSFNHL